MGNAWPSIYGCIHFLQTVSESMLSLHARVRMPVQHSKHRALIPRNTPGIIVTPCYQRTGTARKSFQIDILGGRMSPALFACNSVSPFHACCSHSCSEHTCFIYCYLKHLLCAVSLHLVCMRCPALAKCSHPSSRFTLAAVVTRGCLFTYFWWMYM